MQILIGERLFELRIQKQMTQEELAERLGVTRQSVSKWESNGMFPNVNKLIEICEIFDVSLDYLLRGVEVPETIEEDVRQEPFSEEVPEEQKEGKRAEKRHASLYILFCLVLLGLLFVFFCWLFVSILIHHTWDTTGQKQDMMYVDTIYEQYTKAKVCTHTEDGTYVEQIMWLDVDGIGKNDWLFYYDAGSGSNRMKVNYTSKTLLLPAIMAIEFFLIIILLCMELRRQYASREE